MTLDGDDLLRDLRNLLDRADPVPDTVVDAGKAAFGWRTIDADLAELLADSVVDRQPAGVRSGGADSRLVTFEAEALAIDLELRTERGRILRVIGQVEPPIAVSVEVELDDGTVAATTTSDQHGRFDVRFGRPARMRLRIRRPAGTAIVSAWLPL